MPAEGRQWPSDDDDDDVSRGWLRELFWPQKLEDMAEKRSWYGTKKIQMFSKGFLECTGHDWTRTVEQSWKKINRLVTLKLFLKKTHVAIFPVLRKMTHMSREGSSWTLLQRKQHNALAGLKGTRSTNTWSERRLANEATYVGGETSCLFL